MIHIQYVAEMFIPLTKRVQGTYRKLQTEFVPVDLWPEREAAGHKSTGKKQGSVTYSTD